MNINIFNIYFIKVIYRKAKITYIFGTKEIPTNVKLLFRVPWIRAAG